MNCNGIDIRCRRLGAALTLTALLVTLSAPAQVADLFGSALGTSTNLTDSTTATRPVTPSAIIPPSPPELRRPVGGALPALFRSPEPLQMLNPFAPPEYGDGTQHLATNLVTGQAEGVSLISFRFPSKAPKMKKSEPIKKLR